MVNKLSVTIGFLVLIVFSSIAYITLNDVRIRVDADKSTFYVPNEDYSWLWTVSGREYNSLFDGTSKMNRRLSSITVDTYWFNETVGHWVKLHPHDTLSDLPKNLILINRSTTYIRGPRVVDTYLFDGRITDITQFPISHKIEIYNGTGFFYRYEVRDLVYHGLKYRLTGETELEFGRNMKVELHPGYREKNAWVFASGIVRVQYDIPSDYEVFNVRLFDPPDTFDIYLNGVVDTDRKYEYQTNATIIFNSTDSSKAGCLYVDGVNISCTTTGNGTSFYFIGLLRQRNFTGHNGTSINVTNAIPTASFDIDDRVEVHTAIVNVTGFEDSGSPADIQIKLNNTVIAVLPGTLSGQILNQTNLIVSGVSSVANNFSFITAGEQVFRVNISSSGGDFRNGTLQLTGFDLTEDNILDFDEPFNDTFNFNGTRSVKTASPGTLDDFESNNTRWSATGATQLVFSYRTGDVDDYLRHGIIGDAGAGGSETSSLDYSDAAGDLRNSSIIEIMANWTVETGSCSVSCFTGSADIFLYATDGTSTVELWTKKANFGGISGGDSKTAFNNFTLLRQSSDSTSWQVKVNGSGGIKDISSLDFSNQITLQFVNSYSAGAEGNTRSVQTKWDLHNIDWGGAWLGRHNNGTHEVEGNITSNIVNSTGSNVTGITLNKIDYVPSGTAIDYFVSANCNETGVSFESVTPGFFHAFTDQGKSICWKAKLNSTDNWTSPVVRHISLDIVSAIIQNISIDIGDDGTVDFNFVELLNATNSPVTVNISSIPITDYFDDNIGDELTFLLPISIITNSSGIVQVHNLQAKQNPNSINLNASVTDGCYNDTSTDRCDIETSFANGKLQFNDLKVDFRGSWTLPVVVQNSSEVLDTQNILVRYSKFNVSYPGRFKEWFIQPFKSVLDNIQPAGQSDSTSFWRIHNLAYDDSIDIYTRYNNTIDTCVTQMKFDGQNFSAVSSNITHSLNVTNLTATNQQLFNNISVNDSGNIWTYTNISCSGSSNLIVPLFCFNSLCTDCVVTHDAQDNCQVVE